MGKKYRKYTREILQEAVDASDSDQFVRYRGTGQLRRRTADDILQILPFGSRRAKASHLRRAMAESGVSYHCANCRMPAMWHGKPLTLHVDHISGDFHDNRLANLRFLCPNCHAQTPNFAGRGKGGYRIVGTEGCGPSTASA